MAKWCMASSASRPLRRLLQCRLVQLVVERLEADAELFGGLGLVAAVAVERIVDGLHLQVAERDWTGDADLRQRAAAAGKALRQMVGRDRRRVAQVRSVL